MIQSCNFTHFTSKFYQICAFFANFKKFSITQESPYFPSFSANVVNAKFEERDGHGKLRNSYTNGKVIEKSWKNKYLKSLWGHC